MRMADARTGCTRPSGPRARTQRIFTTMALAVVRMSWNLVWQYREPGERVTESPVVSIILASFPGRILSGTSPARS